MPFVFRSDTFWTFFAFYAAFEVLARRHAAHILAHLERTLYRADAYQTVGALDPPPAAAECLRSHVVVITARYLPSLWHSLTCVVLSLAALAQAHDATSGWPDVTFYQVLAHSFGYLLADTVVDQDPVYFSHHIAPLGFGEMMIRCGGSLYHAVVFGLVCELGNVYSHSRALYLMSVTSPAYNVSVRAALFVTRILSLVPALLVFLCDVPDTNVLCCGLGTLVCLLGIYGSNLAALEVAASADPGAAAAAAAS